MLLTVPAKVVFRFGGFKANYMLARKKIWVLVSCQLELLVLRRCVWHCVLW